MGLSCSCDYELEPGMVCWEHPAATKLNTKTKRKCHSCGATIHIGDDCAELGRFKVPDTDIEIRIYGEDGEIPRAPKFMCETCHDLLLNLEELGYCVQPWEDQRELVKQYAEMHATKQPDG